MPPSKRAGIISLGCPKNLVDTECLMGVLRDGGWTFTADPGKADLLVVNTCAFIEGAVRESEEAVEEVLKRKEARRGVRVVVAGCLVNRLGASLRRKYPAVDLFLTPGRIGRLGELLRRPEPRASLRSVSQGFLPPPDLARAWTTGPWAYLKVSDGCDNRCAYCLIPGIRGRHRSRPLGNIMAEAERLTGAGVRELNLIGQDITRWRGAGGRDLADLLEHLSALPGDFRIRLLYLHPARVSRRLIDLIAGNPRICPYLDLPIQHAHDRILRAMNRPYTRRELSRLYRALRDRIPGVALRTTVMVAFPGEGRREFNSLLSFIGDHPFDNLGAFVFSPQEGTRAARLRGRVDPREARERYHAVMSLQAGIARRLWTARRGAVAEALVTGAGEEEGRWIGRTVWQAPEVDGIVRLSGEGAPGSLVRVRITGSSAYDLRGVILKPVRADGL